MSYATDDDIRTAIRGALTLETSASLPAHWDAIVPRANGWAYRKLRSVMFGRGFAPATIDAWEANADWQQRIAVGYAMWLAEKGNPDRGRESWDELQGLLKELAVEVVVVNDAAVTPTTAHKPVNTGDEDTGGDTFTMDTTL